MTKQATHSLNVKDFNRQTKADKYDYILKNLDNHYNHSIELLDVVAKEDDIGYYYQRVEEESKLDFLSKHEPYLDKLPSSNGSAVFKKSSVKIGMVADTFLFNSFKDVCDLEYISYDDKLNKNFDLVIIASTWRGIDRSWTGVAGPQSDKRQVLYDKINEFRNANIPVVFYSKEDPVNYSKFKDIAKECDVIFTSCEEKIDDYKSFCNNDKVYVLQFGANPHYHNPVGTRSDITKKFDDEVLFAGSWMKRYPHRNNDLKRIINGVLDANKELTIIDRNLELRASRYNYPQDFIPYLTTPVPHEKLMKLHKLYRFAINVNSVKYSSSMFANRVFELQAFGNLLLSNYSVGVNNQFPNVFIVNDREDVVNIMSNYDEDYLNSLRAKSIRNVMRNNTTYHRVDQILETLNMEAVQREPKILVVGESNHPSIRESFDRQLNVKADFSLKQKNYNITDYDFVTYFDESNFYEEYYLEDLLSAFKYTNVDYVTKDNNKEAHNYTHNYENKFRTMFKSNFVENNRPNNMSSTLGYVLDESELFHHVYESNYQPELSVIVPIYNNGEYLEEKCMKSLKRSSIFDKMEIIFVNDGSSDPRTKQILNRLTRHYPNIIRFDFESGSGSASRPRNKGVELATTEYVTYLDPDNEAIGDGYKHLLDEIKAKDVDLAIGNIIKEDNKNRRLFKFSQHVKKYNRGELYVSNPKSFLINSGLRSQSIQALIVKKSIIIDNNIVNLVGAAGQDTVFFQELMLNIKNFVAINKVIHIYYAAVTGSVTNSISSVLFDKYLKLEKTRIPFLKENGLMETYMNERFNFYFMYWYIPRLVKVKPEEKKEAISRFLEIYSMYDNFKRPKDDDLDEMIAKFREELHEEDKI
ncbi:glycosyltransferase [Staphylococcus massiliensis]|uniref:glycosyltransferase n=1 Tax=Staphylococcus massiliensis TaxID=555791 RepID=UPI001EDF7F4A|nr:glycosyltransferase [Staphylococcus massiliensis]